jgi:quinoprotein glucose dehydrogenase
VKIFRSVEMLAVLLLLMPGALAAQEWTAYGGDAGGTRYSPLKQIDASNVKDLKVAWEFHTGDVSDGTELPAHSSF